MDALAHILVIPSWYPPHDGGEFFERRWQAMKKRGWKIGIPIGGAAGGILGWILARNIK